MNSIGRKNDCAETAESGEEWVRRNKAEAISCKESKVYIEIQEKEDELQKAERSTWPLLFFVVRNTWQLAAAHDAESSFPSLRQKLLQGNSKTQGYEESTSGRPDPQSSEVGWLFWTLAEMGVVPWSHVPTCHVFSSHRRDGPRDGSVLPLLR